MKAPIPSFTPGPNIFYDELFKTLKEGELRIVLVLVRQTYGWHKAADRISLSQLAEKSGMERSSVCKSLNSLIAKGIVIKHKFGEQGRERCYYALVMESIEEETRQPDDGIESEEEISLISNNLDRCSKNTPPVFEKHPPSVLKTPTKETPTKETIQKKQQHPPLTPPSPKREESPSAPAAALSKCAKPEVKKPAFYRCLIDVDITERDKVAISSRYSEEQVSKVVQCAKNKSGINCLAAWIKGMLSKGDIEITPTVEEKEDINKNYALRYHGKKSGNAEFDASGHTYAELNVAGTTYQKQFYYKDKSFMDKLLAELHKFRFLILGAT